MISSPLGMSRIAYMIATGCSFIGTTVTAALLCSRVSDISVILLYRPSAVLDMLSLHVGMLCSVSW